MDNVLGRRDETSRLLGLVADARRARGGAVVVLGEPGIGKSVLLDGVASAVDDFLVLRASGVEFESELAYSALHQLCVPVLGHLDALPGRQREALRIAFGLESGTPDPFLAGAAALGLLSEHDRPLLCLVDDAQWLDHASARALAFVARRVSVERVAVVFAAREGSAELDRLPRIDLGPLGEREARALLAREIRVPLDERVRDRVVAEARGNPLALVELARTAGVGGMAGGYGLPAPVAAERSFQARLAGLPDATRLLLTVAAAEPVGDPGMLWRAAALLGIGDVVASQDLVEFGARVRFVHPLARSAVYRGATDGERRRAHDALARVGDPLIDPDRVAWHRALAAVGPDEDVAAALVDSASRARARGGVAAAAAFLERAAALTFEPGLRVDRVLAAAEAKLSAGDFDAASGLLTAVSPDDPRVDLVRGRISFARFRGEDLPVGHLLRAALALADKEPADARTTYVDAVEMGILTGGLSEVIEAARVAPPVSGPVRGVDVILDGVVALVDEGDVERLRAVVADGGDEVWVRWPTLGYLLALEFWDGDAMHDIAARTTAAGRESGALHLLPVGLAMLATVTAHAGDFGAAQEMISEEEALASATGAAPLVYPRLHLAALRGRRGEAEELFSRVGPQLSLSVRYASAVLFNGLADYPAALEAARQAVATRDLGLAGQALPELVEAAVRCGHVDEARAAWEELAARVGGNRWGVGMAAYARALARDDEDAYREAASVLDDGATRIWHGRARLVHGEWLRRQGRRRDARTELRAAHDVLSGIGAEAFAARAAGELRATGERARSRTSPTSDSLTVQEVHIARLVADGATSKEVAAKLFVSPRTVDAHLRNIFRKLSITSRRQLRDLPEIR
ncbi:LuxR family transcriptional regulator [Saccharothrix violaceirubra]|uniref:DNA-binding CsgD family transcriptional regulator n=1 Tax=Saccharothrix violaceirubra TaxID=413306 RepID=A0A7W7WWA3_9PSEU|nr:LuxR family transcriptional regulator [Saccharothrix violaceirubra]MBB4966184.1 DNA-binding CsgD family transcriptional regulator [Saccharothrix violaceirubra]